MASGLQEDRLIIVAKQRNGPTDTVFLNFIANYTRFDNRDSAHAA